MKIAFVSEHASPLAALGGVDAGGQNVHVAALAGELARDGHDVTVYTRRDDPATPVTVRAAPGFDVVHVPAGPPTVIGKDEMLPFMRSFGEWMAEHWRRTGPPDVVHAHFWMSGLASLHAGRALGVPVVQTFHALGSLKRRHQGDRDTSPVGRIQMETGIGQQCDLIIATCTDEVAELEALGISAAKVRVVPCGVDLTLFTPRDEEPLRVGRQPYRLLSVGRLVERKGVDSIIQALVELPDAELVIAGGPPPARLASDPEAVRLGRLARDLGVHRRVRLLGGVEHAALPALFRAADVVVCTPWYEPFGIVPLEAAASGRVVVGSAVGGLLDTIDDGVTGILVPPRDPVALAAALADLQADPVRRRRLGRAARRRAQLLYSWPSVAHSTVAAYRSVVIRPSRMRDREVSGV